MESLDPPSGTRHTLPTWWRLVIVPKNLRLGSGLDDPRLGSGGTPRAHVALFSCGGLGRARFLELQWLTYSLCSADVGELALRSEEQLEEH